MGPQTADQERTGAPPVPVRNVPALRQGNQRQSGQSEIPLQVPDAGRWNILGSGFWAGVLEETEVSLRKFLIWSIYTNVHPDILELSLSLGVVNKKALCSYSEKKNGSVSAVQYEYYLCMKMKSKLSIYLSRVSVCRVPSLPQMGSFRSF